MSYAQKTLLNKKLPAYMGFLVLLFALVITIVLSGNTVLFVTKATVGAEPKNIQVSNVSATSFTVSYTTDTPATGSISYGTDPSTPTLALDDRDQLASGAAAEHQIHFITLKNLIPTTKYYYVINSGSQKTENNGAPYEITTAATTSQNPNQLPLAGTVALSDGSTPSEGIVYVAANNIQLATLINPDGTYQMQLNQLTADPTPLPSDTVLQVQAVTATQQSTAKVLLINAAQVPKIILPQNYDFTLGTSQEASAPSVPAISDFPQLATPEPVSSPEITTPTNSQAFKDQQPLFQGRALPNTDVEITIQSQQEILTKVHSDTSGVWEFRPPVTLAPGIHTITIKSLDATGIIQTLSRSFTVYAQGSKFIEPSVSPVASASASPTPVVLPTAKPEPTATPAPTSAPVKPTMQPTAVPSKTPIPKTGSSAAIVGAVTGIAILGIGALLFVLSVV